jgi:hypothetical protein
MTIGEEKLPCIPEWRSDIDSLAFHPPGHSGLCVIHRQAFRTLIGHPATDQECLAYFRNQFTAFEVAALEKIACRNLSTQANFHLTSRDVSRSQSSADPVRV